MERRGVRRKLAWLPRLILVASLGPVVASAPAEAAPESFAKFFGEYVGEAVSEGAGEIDKRDIHAKIAAHGKGFAVTWKMVLRKASGDTKRIEYTNRFLPTARKDIYSSAMRTDMFGNAVPLDPLKGDPYVWARIDGPTLRIYALVITDEGGYEMQVFDRTLTPTGMTLSYSRLRDGEVLRGVKGTLRRIR